MAAILTKEELKKLKDNVVTCVTIDAGNLSEGISEGLWDVCCHVLHVDVTLNVGEPEQKGEVTTFSVQGAITVTAEEDK